MFCGGIYYQEENDEIRARKGEFGALEWEDYKAMPFTLCVSAHTLFFLWLHTNPINPYSLFLMHCTKGNTYLTINLMFPKCTCFLQSSLYIASFGFICVCQVVNETLRIANIIGGVFRRAMTDVNING